jgi:hypothetical protein
MIKRKVRSWVSKRTILVVEIDRVHISRPKRSLERLNEDAKTPA